MIVNLLKLRFHTRPLMFLKLLQAVSINQELLRCGFCCDERKALVRSPD